MERTVFIKKAVKAITVIMPLAVIISFVNDIFICRWADDSALLLNGLGSLIGIIFIAWAVYVILTSYFRNLRGKKTRVDPGAQEEGNESKESDVVDAIGWKVK